MALTKISRSLLDTGVSDSSDATAITIDSSENVMIGTTDAQIYDHTSGEGIVFRGGEVLDIARSGDSQMTLNRMSDEGANISLHQAGTLRATIGTKGSGGFYIGTGGDNERMRIDSSGNVGIGTDAIPHGGVGAAKLAVEGGNQNFTTGPHVQFTTDADDYPVMQMLNYGHDNVSINFDTYHDSAGWKSADAGSNFQIYKISDQLTVRSGSGVSAGSTISFTNSLALDPNGQLYINSGFGGVGKAYGVRAWVNFNGSGTVAIRGSGNVSSITDNGIGSYTINFTSAMPDTNYLTSGIGGLSSANLIAVSQPINNSGSISTSSVTVHVVYQNGTGFDAPYIGVEIIR